MMDDRLDALEQHARVMTEALLLAVSQVAALTAVNGALMATLDDQHRTVIREAALAAIGDGPHHDRACSLVEALTQEPAAAVAEHQTRISAALAELPARLQ